VVPTSPLGQIIFHRFYYRISMAKCDVRAVAKAALWLASKVEEEPRKAQDILNVFHASAMHRSGQRIEPLQVPELATHPEAHSSCATGAAFQRHETLTTAFLGTRRWAPRDT
jgi:hypothetical protein